MVMGTCPPACAGELEIRLRGDAGLRIPLSAWVSGTSNSQTLTDRQFVNGAAITTGLASQSSCLPVLSRLRMPPDAELPMPLLAIVGRQLSLVQNICAQWALWSETGREHLEEVRSWMGLRPFCISDYRRFNHHLADLAQQSNRVHPTR